MAAPPAIVTAYWAMRREPVVGKNRFIVSKNDPKILR
jgi:hypothetical protein